MKDEQSVWISGGRQSEDFGSEPAWQTVAGVAVFWIAFLLALLAG